MKKRLFCVLTASAILFQLPVHASQYNSMSNGNRTSVHLGYQHGEMKDFGALDGANLKLQYETDYSVGFLGSVSALKNSWGKNPLKKEKNTVPEKDHSQRKAEYYSATVGPTFRLNDAVSLYALTGLAHTKVKLPSDNKAAAGSSFHSSNKFAYGFGMIANVTDNLSMTVGYEGSKALFDEKAHSINGMVVSTGYRF